MVICRRLWFGFSRVLFFFCIGCREDDVCICTLLVSPEIERIVHKLTIVIKFHNSDLIYNSSGITNMEKVFQ